MNRPCPGLLAFTVLMAIAMSIAPVYAAKSKKKTVRQVTYCNELPYKQCVKCAIARGYPPSRYGSYCATRR